MAGGYELTYADDSPICSCLFSEYHSRQAVITIRMEPKRLKIIVFCSIIFILAVGKLHRLGFLMTAPSIVPINPPTIPWEKTDDIDWNITSKPNRMPIDPPMIPLIIEVNDKLVGSKNSKFIPIFKLKILIAHIAVPSLTPSSFLFLYKLL